MSNIAQNTLNKKRKQIESNHEPEQKDSKKNKLANTEKNPIIVDDPVQVTQQEQIRKILESAPLQRKKHKSSHATPPLADTSYNRQQQDTANAEETSQEPHTESSTQPRSWRNTLFRVGKSIAVPLIISGVQKAIDNPNSLRHVKNKVVKKFQHSFL